MFSTPKLPLIFLVFIFLLSNARAVEVTLGQEVFTIPDGFTVEKVAGPPLVDRPITASLDEQGRLYVADSSGSNDPVQKQLAEKPHRIVRLEDRNGDGQFDHSVVFADKMMFPEGTLWYDGSLYVAAPPSIWRLTDNDGDGIADQREEWFDGKTLTSCRVCGNGNSLSTSFQSPRVRQQGMYLTDLHFLRNTSLEVLLLSS